MNTLETFRQDGIDNQLGFLTSSFSHLARQYLLQQLQQQGKDAGLKIDELPVIARIFEQPGLPQAELNQLTLKDKTTVTRLLSALEKKQLVMRKPDPDDRRARKIYLTPKGRQLLTDVAPVALTMQETLFRGIAESDLHITRKTMKLLYQRIAKQIEAG